MADLDRNNLDENDGPDFRGDELDDGDQITAGEPPGDDTEKSPRTRSTFLISVGLVVALVGLTLIVFFIWYKNKGKDRPVRTVVRGPVPSVDYYARATFYVLAQSKEKEDFIRLDVVFVFSGLNGKECFERNEVIYRDVTYRFLKKQKPEKNAQFQWSRIIEGPLRKQITGKKDPCLVKSIHLEALQRI